MVLEVLIAVASLLVEHWLYQGLSGYGTQAWSLHGMWDSLGSGIQPMFPALTGGFFSHTVKLFEYTLHLKQLVRLVQKENQTNYCNLSFVLKMKRS